ncbi:MAG: hypothetical protein HOQ25_07490 [Mesorhizobium sp.]|nr:hypothetical protein [Mesorhizobium sp.]
MSTDDWTILSNGRAQFIGPQVGADDEPHMAFAVDIGNGRLYFGEYDFVFESDRIHYNIEIISVGFISKYNIGNTHIGARAAFSTSEIKSIAGLITALILTGTGAPYPLNTRDRFRGGISYRAGWVRTK